jgi:hypothetical protein
MAQAVGRSVEYLVTGTERAYVRYSEMAFDIAKAADHLDDTGSVRPFT